MVETVARFRADSTTESQASVARSSNFFQEKLEIWGFVCGLP